jgi:hypothetical protein
VETFFNNILGDITINNNSMVEPGCSRKAVKDNPGKDIGYQITNIFLQGLDPGRAGQVQEGVQGDSHDDCEVSDEVSVQEVHGQADHSGLGGEVREGVQGGSHDDQKVSDEPITTVRHGQGQEDHLQHRVEGGGAAEHWGGVQDGGGGDHHLRQGGVVGEVVGRIATSFTSVLSSPKSSDSPGWKKSRRRRIPDGLVQRRIEHFVALNSNLNISSDVSFPSGGPQVYKKFSSSRGIKRGVWDQMEGPSGQAKKVRLKD